MSLRFTDQSQRRPFVVLRVSYKAMTSDEERSEEGRKLWTRALDHLLSLWESNDEVFEDRETVFDVFEVGRILLREERLREGRRAGQYAKS